MERNLKRHLLRHCKLYFFSETSRQISKVSKACQNSLLPTQRTSIMEFFLQLCIDFVGVKMHFNATFNEQLFYHNLNELCLNSIIYTKQMSYLILLFKVILKLQITAMAFWQ